MDYEYYPCYIKDLLSDPDPVLADVPASQSTGKSRTQNHELLTFCNDMR